MHSWDLEQHPLFPSTFKGLKVGSKAKNSILLDKIQNNENSNPPTTPVIEGQTRPFLKLLLRKLNDFFANFVF